jgi:hypothetical protein
MRVLVVLLLVLGGCAFDPAPPARDGVATDPAPERVAAALRFAALAPLPPGARVPRLDVQGGIDTRVALVVAAEEGAAGTWLAASGFPPAAADGGRPQQRLANPDGAIVYRDVAVTAPAPGAAVVEVTAFTT